MKRIHFSDILPAVLSGLFLLGILFVFHPCGPKEDGTWMSCHWAGVAVTVCAALITVLSLAHLALPDPKVKTVLSVLTILAAAAAAVIPGNVIHLCMMAGMRCRSIMRPAVIVFSVLIILSALWNILLSRKRGNK